MSSPWNTGTSRAQCAGLIEAMWMCLLYEMESKLPAHSARASLKPFYELRVEAGEA